MGEYNMDRLKGKPYFNNDGWWVCPFNFVEEVSKDLKGKKVSIHDVTLRDGEQTLGVSFSPEERVRIAEALTDMGVPRIEVGMPIAAPEILKGIKAVVKRDLKSEIVAFIRVLKSDIDVSIDCGVKTVILEHSTNPYACDAGYGLNKTQVIDRIVTAALYAKEKKLKTIFMGWDLTRGDDLDFIKDVYTAVVQDGKVDGVVVVDTFGVALPQAIRFIFRKLREWIPDVPLEFHTHDEFGLAIGSVLEAVGGGAGVIHTAVNALGDRTGNAATEEVVMMLELLAKIDTGIALDRIKDVSLLVENISRRTVPLNKPIVGRGLCSLETGIGVDLTKKMNRAGFKLVVEPFMLGLVGQDPLKLVLGKNSGVATVEYFLDKAGLSATKDQVKEITDRVKYEGRLQHAILTESQFARICKEVMG
jgi:methanogen homocitrate synthase